MKINKSHKFLDEGIKTFPNYFDKRKSKKLLNETLYSRNFKNIFLNKNEFKKEKKFIGVNPRPGRNLAEKLDTNFIFSEPKFHREMKKVLGDKWRILGYKLVMGVPDKIIPKWIKNEINNNPVANLGAYIKEKYRDITYFRGIDFHQDIIDFPDKKSDFITVYIYLDKVKSNSSPLYVLKKSYMLGASIFPHDIKKINKKYFHYSNNYKKKLKTKILKLVGNGGSMSYWHCNTLHGTQPHTDDEPRVSMRILVEKNSNKISNCLIDKANKKINGSLILSKTRNDLNKIGKSTIKKNLINKNV